MSEIDAIGDDPITGVDVSYGETIIVMHKGKEETVLCLGWGTERWADDPPVHYIKYRSPDNGFSCRAKPSEARRYLPKSVRAAFAEVEAQRRALREQMRHLQQVVDAVFQQVEVETDGAGQLTRMEMVLGNTRYVYEPDDHFPGFPIMAALTALYNARQS